MTKQVTVAATQMSCTRDSIANIENAKKLIRQSAGEGAQIILIQELFESEYFCCLNKPEEFNLAKPYKDNPLLKEMSVLAKELSVVLPISFFEKDNNTFYNSLAVIDADGTISEPYRKSIFQTVQVMKKNIIFILAIPALKFLTPNMQKLVSAFAGISGF